MRIRTQFIITMLVFGAILLVVSVSLVITGQQVQRLEVQEEFALKIERQANEIGYLSNEYLLYRESQQRVRWESKFAALSADLAQLTPDTPEEKALVNNIKSNQQRLRSVFTDVVNTFEAPGTDGDRAVDMAAIQVPWSRMAVQSQGIVFDAGRLSHMFVSRVDQARLTNIILMVVMLGVFGAYFLTNYYLVFRRTLNSIETLHAGTDIIGSGNLDFAIQIKNSDEIGELSRAFNRMTSNLKEITASKSVLEREIAERKRAQEQAARLNAQLEQESQELQQMNVQLEESLAQEHIARAEAEEGRQILESLMQYIPEVLIIADAPTGNIRMMSRHGQDLTGRPFEELRGIDGQSHPLFQRLYEPDGAKRIPFAESALGLALTHGRVSVNQEMILSLDNGEKRTILSSAGPIRDKGGKITGAVAVWRDITIRKKVEEEVKSLARFPSENPNPVLRLGADGAILYANECSAPLLEAWGCKVGDLAPDFWRTVVDQAYMIGTRQSLEISIQDKVYTTDVVPIAGAGYVNLYSRDVTAIKRAADDIKRLNRDLEQRAVELEIANRELESFSYSISHDLRMPLAAVKGFASILLTDYQQTLPPEALKLVELIGHNSTEMNNLVEGLLSFSRSIRQPIKKQNVDMTRLTRQVLDDLEAQQAGRRVEITVGDLPLSQADPILIKQVMVNLLSNALKFTRTREVARIEVGCTVAEFQGSQVARHERADSAVQRGTLNPETVQPETTSSSLKVMPWRGDETVYYVRDNGVGFDMQEADKLFGVFQRYHHAEDFEGTGVGLAIVERIIRRHGGWIRAEAEIDRGATFYFTL